MTTKKQQLHLILRLTYALTNVIRGITSLVGLCVVHWSVRVCYYRTQQTVVVC